MITNDRQLANAREKMGELQLALADVSDDDAIPYRDLASELQGRIDEYLAARDGRWNVFMIKAADDLAAALIKARIARGWTQKQLADELEVSEQMVQRDESRQYENVGLAKVADLLDALDYELVGHLRPRFVAIEQWRPEGSMNSARASSQPYDLHWSAIRTVQLYGAIDVGQYQGSIMRLGDEGQALQYTSRSINA